MKSQQRMIDETARGQCVPGQDFGLVEIVDSYAKTKKWMVVTEYGERLAPANILEAIKTHGTASVEVRRLVDAFSKADTYD